jgi:hypothetical protein
VLAGDVEGRPVIHRGTNDGYTEGCVDRRLEVQQLHRNMALIVVHRHHKVVRTMCGAEKDRVRRHRPFTIHAHRLAGFDGWLDELLILGAEQTMFSGVGIQPADSDARLGLSEQLHGLVAELDRFDDPFGVQFGCPTKAHVCRYMHYAQLLSRQQHARVLRSTKLGDVLCMTRKDHSTQSDCLFVQGSSHHCISISGETHQRRVMHIAHRCRTVLRTQRAHLDIRVDRKHAAVLKLHRKIRKQNSRASFGR